MDDHLDRVLAEPLRRLAEACDAPLVLAVSGGLDSMALMHVAARVAPGRVAAVAVFDHRSGPASRDASRLAIRAARRLGFRTVTGALSAAAPVRDGQEATWRRARHAFLRHAARTYGARLVTAHTRDDQVETVLMRVLRASGARGLAGLAAPGLALRPWLGARRAEVEAFASMAGVEWHEDPSNRSRRFLRNRVRHDLLPALRAVRPSVDDELVATGERAAAWRADLDAVIDQRLDVRRTPDGALHVASAELAEYDRDSLATVWNALAGRVGLALDRRGTSRAAAFTIGSRRVGVIPLSGGWRLEALGERFRLARSAAPAEAPLALAPDREVRWGKYRFRPVAAAGADGGEWSAALPVGAALTVRGWRAGDRLVPAGGQGRRRVARYLSDARVRGEERAAWPVVAAGADVWWIPGVRRSDAATDRSGRPVQHYLCERTDR